MRSRREKAATRDISSEQHLCGPASSYSPCPCPAHAACPSAAAVRGISQSRGSAYHSLCGLLCTAVISGHNNCRLCILQEEGDPRDGVVWIHRDNDAAGDENCELKERQCWSLLDHHAHPRGDQRLSLVLPWRCAEATVAPQLELCDVQQVRCSCDSGGPKLLVCPDLQCTVDGATLSKRWREPLSAARRRGLAGNPKCPLLPTLLWVNTDRKHWLPQRLFGGPSNQPSGPSRCLAQARRDYLAMCGRY
mmetsp:Transcript_5571/g.15556  ORF Transcript_5571/g.15556 Transcript_5571/m.15556 type:complete len:249 (+) Transcript_5571:2996-3742(+)